jgi:hypothetical protein
MSELDLDVLEREIRSQHWGDDLVIPMDVYVVPNDLLALIQRVRALERVRVAADKVMDAMSPTDLWSSSIANLRAALDALESSGC